MVEPVGVSPDESPRARAPREAPIAPPTIAAGNTPPEPWAGRIGWGAAWAGLATGLGFDDLNRARGRASAGATEDRMMAAATETTMACMRDLALSDRCRTGP
ncbi:hypothetical protein EV668_1751 [Enterovirga rhinocerotis]|uniref:Uncharacterized protein n=1 Tax=Enterovirga rhinocerotis TaxID=1339210 RepID=A0A4R7C772_9HYPH|nr:hypothetical protein EV668_1751 [Enterovirga rhinocerotis]